MILRHVMVLYFLSTSLFKLPSKLVTHVYLNIGGYGELISVEEEMTYAQARQWCGTVGGRLPLPEDDESNEDLTSFINNTGIHSTWIDARFIETPWISKNGIRV